MRVIGDECIKCVLVLLYAQLALSAKANLNTKSMKLASTAVLANPYAL